MKKIARYTNYYSDEIFDDEKEQPEEQEEDIEKDGGRPFVGPLKVDDKVLLRKMELLHSLMVSWDIKPWDFVPYLQRFILRPDQW